MKRRVTRRGFTIAAIAGLLFLAATTAQAGWLYVLSAGVLGLVVASLFVRHRLRSVEVVRTMPRRVRQGDDIHVALEIRNPARYRTPLMRIEDVHPATEVTRILVEPIDARSSSSVETVQRALRRGVFAGGEVVVSSGVPFGFVRATRRVDVAGEITIVPRFVELRSFPILEPSSSPMDVLHERARTGAGEEYLGVREYRPGDPRHAVHWRSTARAGKLIVREFQAEVATRLLLVIAGSDTGEPPDSAFEMLVAAAASIGAYAIQTGHPVEALAPDGTGGVSRLIEPDRVSLLEWLAAVQPVDVALDGIVAGALDRRRAAPPPATREGT
ncbi:MAG TPA: DUF58 domain-containing protein, partial [Actinomycetota bacterium]|nr:DUF58 domain-containing protein [Actinomycetota bacterium]